MQYRIFHILPILLLLSITSCKKVDPIVPPVDPPVNPPVEEPLSPLEKLLAESKTGSPLKKQYSDYVKDYKETLLFDFDELPGTGVVHDDFTYSIDNKYQREGKGALRMTANKDYRGSLPKLIWCTNPVTAIFRCSVPNPKTCTLKLWLFVDNVENVGCDHDKNFGDFADQATFFFRAFDSKGRTWCWNHTLTGNGWHEVELSFNIHNGHDEDFDFSDIVSFGVLASVKKETVIEIDALRLVEYHTSYTPQPMNPGERLISNAEYDAFDGVIVQEWYGASYDLDDKVEGKSSLRNCGDSSVSDFRTIIANLDIPLDYNEDVLVFYLKLKNLNSVIRIFIELNEVQDTHEYEQRFSMNTLKEKGLTQDDTWAKIVIPLTEFNKNLSAGYPSGSNIVLHNFRLVADTSADGSFDLHIDNIYLTTKTALSGKN